jgi:transposase
MKVCRVIPAVEMVMSEMDEILERVRSALGEEDHEKLKMVVETLAFVTGELERKSISIQRLRKLLFGHSSEKSCKVLRVIRNREELRQVEEALAEEEARARAARKRGRTKRKGHGRNGSSAYTGAEKIEVRHDSLKPGDACPEQGCDGKVYRQRDPAVLVRLMGAAPVQGKVYELEKFRCNLCGKLFTAPAPEGVGERKYDETAASMIGCLKYGSGFPFHRLSNLQSSLGIPLAEVTQWDLVKNAAELIAPAWEELVEQAAQGEVLHNDDTPMKVLSLLGERKARDGPPGAGAERKGVFTSGVISKRGEQKIALFFTGNRHAGENLAEVLKRRADGLAAPIQMCDGLSRNLPGELKVILSNCMAHSRRRFVDVVENFPEPCRYVIETLAEVYKTDAEAQEKNLTPEERLRLHQAESGPRMETLRNWLDEQFDEKKVEPNSGLGEAISYMKKHWSQLTLFLRASGAPLDNNVCERSLKKAILHRKNSLFYKTRNGARVGDIFMSLIHTAELCGVDPFHYLTELQRNSQQVSKRPTEWMPWNYKDALEALSSSRDS